ncbi:MAG: pirin family protein [Oligoflexia bacterium]|nr:pirin family protein [Oligoflexia bacterium]
MTSICKISKVWKSRPTIEGAGVHLKRAFGNNHVPMFDPFLLLDDFHSNFPPHYIKGFPWHPHRGIETITYVIHGRVAHGDSMGNSGTIGEGDVQWMTAGNGIIHQEMPQGDKDSLMWGFQIWANLPATHKMMDPRYRGFTAKEIPQLTLDSGVQVKIICGKILETMGPVQDVVIDPTYLDVTVPPRTTFLHDTTRGHKVFAYVVDGQAYFDQARSAYAHDVVGTNYFDMKKQCVCDAENLILFEDGDQVVITTEDHPVRFLLVSGRPLGEPVAWYGPIVMNTQQELQTAFEEYENGTFLKHKKNK